MQLTDKALKEIAEFLDMQFKCYVHKQSGEIIAWPKDHQQHYFSDEENPWREMIDKVDDNMDQYQFIEELPSHESFSIMEDFVDTVNDNLIKARLLQAMEGHKPFANFKHQIHNNVSSYREKWFAFKEGRLTEWVKKQLQHNNADSS